MKDNDLEIIPWQEFSLWGNEKKYAADAIESTWVSGGGYVSRLEREFGEFIGNPLVLSTSNGTSAIQLAYLSLGIGVDDEVIVPGFGFLAAANVLVQMGAVPVFSDISPTNWNSSATDIQEKITSRTKAVVVIHNYGISGNIKKISELCKSLDIPLIEDCAEAIFSDFEGEHLGTFGDVATWSLHATKTISSGEGGLVACKEQHLFDRMRLIRSHGLARAERHYWHEEFGNNFRLSNVLAALGVAQLECADEIRSNKTRVYTYYKNNLWHLPHFRFQSKCANSDVLVWGVGIQIVLVSMVGYRDKLIARLAASRIEVRPGFYTPTQLPIYENLLSKCDFACADIASSILVLPSSPRLSECTLRYICSTLTEVLDSALGQKLRYRRISASCENDLQLLEVFLSSLVSGRKTFRYFSKRNTASITNHFATLLLEADGEPVAYGHLEQEDVFWLGVAVGDIHVRNGYGKLVVEKLLDIARESSITEVFLRVDADNSKAELMYLRLGFKVLNFDQSSKLMSYRF